jgi:stress response protein YsnF
MPVEAPVTPAPLTRAGQTPTVKQNSPPPQVPAEEESREEVLIGKSQYVRSSGARAPEGGERAAFESRAPARRLSDEEVHAGGLLKDRVIEVVEMREEPIISREVVVREEVLIRKSVNQRSETVQDTVRRTEVEIEDLPSR